MSSIMEIMKAVMTLSIYNNALISRQYIYWKASKIVLVWKKMIIKGCNSYHHISAVSA